MGGACWALAAVTGSALNIWAEGTFTQQWFNRFTLDCTGIQYQYLIALGGSVIALVRTGHLIVTCCFKEMDTNAGGSGFGNFGCGS